MKHYLVRKQPRRWRYMRDVLHVLVARDFKLRYKRSLLGIGWSLMVPLAQLAVMSVVFNRIIALHIPHYTTFLFTGILPWTWLQGSLMLGAMAVTDNPDLVKQVGFPVTLLPATTVFSQLLHFLLALPILAFFLLTDGYHASASLAALPLVILVQFLLILSLAYIVAALQVKFRDTQYLLGIALFLMFYLTPIFWDDSSISAPYRAVVRLNPLSVILDAYRATLIHGQWPDVVPMLSVAAAATVALAGALAIFRIARDRFVEEL